MSVSSMRSMNEPPFLRAYSQLKSAVCAPPMCSDPVGLGANLTLGLSVIVYSSRFLFALRMRRRALKISLKADFGVL